MVVTESDVDTVSMQQNDKKFAEIGKEQVRPRASRSSAETLQHANAPQNAPETTQKHKNVVYVKRMQYLDLSSPKRTPQDDEDRPTPGPCRQHPSSR